MSTNYNILLKSEKKLKELILSYILLMHEIHKKLWADTNKYINDNLHIIFDNVERRLKRSKDMEDELLDEDLIVPEDFEGEFPTLTFETTGLKDCGIDSIATMEFTLHIMNSESWEDIV